LRPRCRALFEKLYIEEFTYVQRTVKRYGVRVRDLADVTQEVFTRVYDRLSRYDITRPARPWLYVFAIRLASDHCSRRWYLCEELAQAPPEFAAAGPSPEQILIEREAYTAIHQGIERLCPELRTILLLHDVEEKTMPEIVSMLGIPLNTGYTKLRRAREKLRCHTVHLSSRVPSAVLPARPGSSFRSRRVR
jgi:RNA polymerase sigma-70 factor (ECF subfamily)